MKVKVNSDLPSRRLLGTHPRSFIIFCTVLNGKTRHSCLIPDLRGKTHSFAMKNEICSTSNWFSFFCVWVCDLCIGLYFFCIVYIYMHMGAHVFGCVYTSVCTYEGLKLSRIIISCSSHFVHSGKGTQSHTELTDTASLACQFAERLPSLGWDDRQNPYHITRQLPHFEDPNTSPQTCLASI